MSNEPDKQADDERSPRWLRVLLYVLLVIIAIASIRLIDRRAMTRMYEYERAMMESRSASEQR